MPFTKYLMKVTFCNYRLILFESENRALKEHDP